MSTSHFPVILEEEVICFSFSPSLLLWSAMSGALIGIALALRDGHILGAVTSGAFYAVVFAVISHIAYNCEWTPDWPTLVLRWVVGLLVAVAATLVKWLAYDDPYLLSYVITYLVFVGWVMFVTGSVVDRLAKWYCSIRNIKPTGC